MAIGAAVRPNLILFGEVISAQLFSPSSQYAGENQPAGSRNVSIQGVGPGMAVQWSAQSLAMLRG